MDEIAKAVASEKNEWREARMQKYKMEKSKTAIVLIEPQYDFLKPGGSMYQHIAKQLEKRNVIQNLAHLLTEARGKVKKIIYVPFEAFEPGFPELDPQGPGMMGLRGLEMDFPTGWKLNGKPVKGAWVKGTPGPEIIPELTPQKGDLVIRGKRTLDAFWSTSLDYTLRANMIEWVAIVGFHTNWCVESTARSAYDKGYRVIVISDCTGTDTQEEQDYAENVIFRRIGLVMDQKKFLESLV
jgi:nicotinamidase-related amidase